MRKIIRNEKGLTLIEVIISLTILLIIILSVSSLIGVVANGKRLSEQKQEAMLLGQKVMEELQLVEEIEKLETGYQINLLTLADLQNKSLQIEGTYAQQYNHFTVNVELKKSMTAEEYPSNEVEFGMILDIEQSENMIRVTRRGEDSDFFYMDVNLHSQNQGDNSLLIDYQLRKLGDAEYQFMVGGFIPAYDHTTNNPNILLSFEDDFRPGSPLPILIFNQDDRTTLNFYFQNLSSDSSYIKLIGNTGGIKFYNNFIGNGQTKGDLFEIRIQVKSQDKVLFEAYGNKNFKIKG